MNNQSVTNVKVRSPLLEAMRVDPRGSGKRGKKKMVTGLVLTSLVDAFSIMLLYLLCNNTGNGSTLELNHADKLPTAIHNEAVNTGTMVRIEGNRYFLDDKEIDRVQLAQRLQDVKASFNGKTDEKSESLIIQADRSIDFALLEPVIRAGSVTGFHKFKFAVLQEEKSL